MDNINIPLPYWAISVHIRVITQSGSIYKANLFYVIRRKITRSRCHATIFEVIIVSHDQ